MAEPYQRARSFYRNASGTLNVLTATDDTTLITHFTNHTIFLQKLHLEVTAGAVGKTWTFRDSAGTPILLTPAIDASANTHYDFDFGPHGIPLTEEKDFILDVSATGAGGWVTWEAYQKLTKVAAA